MKRLLIGGGLALFCLVACQNARTQSGPTIVVVPPDEMSRAPSLGRATTGSPADVANPSSDALPAASPDAPVPATQPAAYAGLPPALPPAPTQHSYNSCKVEGSYIAMTFDDGPSAALTPKLLDMLKARGIKATFFVVGRNAAEYPQIIQRMVDEGHEIGNHSWSHPSLTGLGSSSLRKQLDDTNAAIEKGGAPRPVVMRPPYGATSARLNKLFDEQYGMKSILWSVDPLDWKYRNATKVYNSIVQKAHPGAIILAHDIHPSTVRAMPDVFDTLLAKGYQFVTVSELIAMENQAPRLVKKEAPAQSAGKTIDD
jgi:peptidoglycan-N-acetylglucosamine deacetylase